MANDAAVFQEANDHTAGSAPRGLNAIADFPIGCLAQRLDNLNHGFFVEHAGDVMGNRRHGFTPAAGRKLSKDQIH